MYVRKKWYHNFIDKQERFPFFPPCNRFIRKKSDRYFCHIDLPPSIVFSRLSSVYEDSFSIDRGQRRLVVGGSLLLTLRATKYAEDRTQ